MFVVGALDGVERRMEKWEGSMVVMVIRGVFNKLAF
jgi:hypothetical protein